MKRLFRRERIWPTAIILVLAGNVALGITLMRIASNDPHFAVEPDYYRRAVGWDTTQAQARRALELGWQVHPALGAVDGKPVPLTLLLTDRNGVPLDSSAVAVVARAVAHADRPVTASLEPTGGAAGTYTAALPIDLPGLWEVVVTIDHGGERLTAPLRLDARTDRPALPVSMRPGMPDPARVAAGLRRE